MADISIPGMFLTGNHAGRPAATDVGGGSLYSCTTHALVYQSDGATWSTWATLGAGGGGSVATDAIFDAKGDLAVGTGADTAAKLTVGANWTRPHADSAQTTGLAWSGFIGAKAYNNASAANGGVDGVLAMNSEEFDTHAFHDTGSNTSRMTIPSGMGGKYLVVAGSFSATSTAIYLLVNGTTKVRSARSTQGAAIYHNVSALVALAAADYIEIAGSASASYGDNSDLNAQTSLAIYFVGP